MSDDSLRDTIAPKSDQLNADDLLTGPITVTVTCVRRGSPDQPVIVAINGGYQPYKPCKSMRRVMINAWGDKGSDWVGKSMTLYCDPTVKFGGVAVGGIRISHMSHIPGKMGIMLTVTRARRSEFIVQPLVVETYPDAKFKKALPAMLEAIDGKKMTKDQVIARCEQTAPLTDEQRAQINNHETKTDTNADESAAF